MKRYEVYRNIRKQAVVFGLSISLFAVQMACIVASLLVMIFSFRFIMVIGLVSFNSVLYIVLLRMSSNPWSYQIKTVFPKMISNKRNSGFPYEQD